MLGSSILSQRAAIAGLAIKNEWFPDVLSNQRANQKLIHNVVDRLPGVEMPVFPSNGNFVVIECAAAGVRPEALTACYQERGIMIRQGAYHTPNFGDRFVKVSTSVPSAWIEEFVELLPAMLEAARGRNDPGKLF
jgi:histidinol-phosphate/aromatic aminotransferase/cobyric acid decarboxylase-like protein